MKSFSKTFGIVLVIGCLCFSWGANTGAMVQSILVPGMGQMGAGGAHKYIGLGIAVTEMFCIHAAVSAASRASSYNRQTSILKNETEWSTDSEKKQDLIDEHAIAFDNAKKEEDNMFLWIGVTGGLWIVNALEALIFVPEKEEELTSGMQSKTPLMTIELNREKIGFAVNKGF